jgi:hypothetical protein
MYGAGDGKVYGTCIPFPTHDVDCKTDKKSVADNLRRKFRCMMGPDGGGPSATQINAAAKKEKSS